MSVRLGPLRSFSIGLWLVLAGGIAGCGEPSGDEKDLGTELCNIHRSVLAEYENPSEAGVQINRKIEKELPAYYENYHVHIVTVRPKDKYAVMKEAVKQATGDDWRCGAVEEFLGL